MKNNIIKNSSVAKNLLSVLPKNCSCHACQTTKNYAKSMLGEEKYKKILKDLLIYH